MDPRTTRTTPVLVAFLALGSLSGGGTLAAPTAEQANPYFYAYHTRLPYTIPWPTATAYTRGYSHIARQERPPDDDSRTLNKTLMGEHADLVVHLAPGSRFVFSRESSYLPYWENRAGRWFVDELVPRLKDTACLYSYVRLIEDEPEHVLVHWRYIPDLNRPDGFTGVVHELFRIGADASVLRTVRRATQKLEDFTDPQNTSLQRLQLTARGIEVISSREARLSKLTGPAVEGSPVKLSAVASPAAWWSFDEGLRERSYEYRDVARESVSGSDCTVGGHKTLWKRGVSGTALAFDGYTSGVALPGSQAPAIEDALSVEAWVVLGAFPWNWAPLLHHSVIEPGPYARPREADQVTRGGVGYYLGIDPYGHAVFLVDGKHVKDPSRLRLYRWTHVAATYGGGRMRLYVDGQEVTSGAAAGKIQVPEGEVLIGLNNRPGRATDPVRGPRQHMPRIYGIEGLIDEIRVYSRSLDPSEVRASYESLRPDGDLRQRPDLEPRILPGETGPAEAFGARYAQLKYHELWDNMWRPSPYPDVVVKFDRMPTSVVYWRGANGAAGWVTENNRWMEDQSTETGGLHGCAEHMADKETRHAYIRVIENTEARVVLHWRYASADVGYLFSHLLHWTDEYHTIYPDGTGVRRVLFRRGSESWQDVQIFTQPGTTCLDNVHLQALSVANLTGQTLDLTWKPPNVVPRNTLQEACVEQVNFKSRYKVFLIFREPATHDRGPPGINPWGESEQSPYTDDPFAGPWNHWPVSQMPSDGRFAVGTDRVTHAALAAARRTYGNMAIYGFNDGAISALIPLARMWNRPPVLSPIEGCEGGAYDKGQRAYILRARGSKMSFRLAASEDSPTVHPCFVIRGLEKRRARANLMIDGKPRPPGPSFRQGVITNTDATPTMVLWVEQRSTAPSTYEMTIH